MSFVVDKDSIATVKSAPHEHVQAALRITSQFSVVGKGNGLRDLLYTLLVISPLRP